MRKRFWAGWSMFSLTCVLVVIVIAILAKQYVPEGVEYGNPYYRNPMIDWGFPDYISLIRPDSEYLYIFVGTVIDKKECEVYDAHHGYVDLYSEVTFQVDEVLRGKMGKTFICTETELLSPNIQIGQRAVVAAANKYSALWHRKTIWFLNEQERIVDLYADTLYSLNTYIPQSFQSWLNEDGSLTLEAAYERRMDQPALSLSEFRSRLFEDESYVEGIWSRFEDVRTMMQEKTLSMPDVKIIEQTDEWLVMRVSLPEGASEELYWSCSCAGPSYAWGYGDLILRKSILEFSAGTHDIRISTRILGSISQNVTVRFTKD